MLSGQDKLPQFVGTIQHLLLKRFDATVRLVIGFAAARGPSDHDVRVEIPEALGRVSQLP